MKRARAIGWDRWVGSALVFVSAIAFGATAIFARLAYDDGVDVPTLLCLRFALAGAALLALASARRLPLPRGRVLVGLLLLGVVGRVGQGLTFFVALTLAPVALVSLLLYLYPAIVALLAALFLRERLTRVTLWALAITLAGTVLTLGPDTGGPPLGIALGLLTAGIYAVYILASSRIVPRAGALASSTVITLACVPVFALLTAIHGPALPRSALGWLAILGSVLIATVLGTLTFFAGLARVGATTASMLSTIEPAVTVALAALILGETIAPLQVLGGALILSAVVALARSRK
jgi:drug/metabolite transporter (DMT)-like permease